MSPTETALRYLECLKTGNVSDFPVAEDITFEDPLTSGPVRGKQHFLDFVAPLAPMFRSIEVHQTIEQGEFVVVRWTAHLVMGTTPVLELFRVRDGLVVESTAYFDPRPITNPVAQPAVA